MKASTGDVNDHLRLADADLACACAHASMSGRAMSANSSLRNRYAISGAAEDGDGGVAQAGAQLRQVLEERHAPLFGRRSRPTLLSRERARPSGFARLWRGSASAASTLGGSDAASRGAGRQPPALAAEAAGTGRDCFGRRRRDGACGHRDRHVGGGRLVAQRRLQLAAAAA